MTPAWTLPWLVVGGLALLFVAALVYGYRRRLQVPTRVFEVQGAPVTEDMQLLLGAYGQGRVTGVVQLREGLQVGYDSGVQLTFVPVHSGGKVGGVRG